MTIEVRTVVFDFEVPAGTAIATPHIEHPDLGDVWLYNIEVRIPPGHNGVTGLSIANSATNIVPWVDGDPWLIDSDRTLDFPVDDETDTALTVAGYNTGVYDHRFYIRFKVTPITLVAVPPAAATIVPVY